MKILILGGDGMIGHKIAQALDAQNHEVIVSLRKKININLGILECYS